MRNATALKMGRVPAGITSARSQDGRTVRPLPVHQDLRLRDYLAEFAASAYRALGLGAKRVAIELGLEDARSARRWGTEGRGNPLYPTIALAYLAARVCGDASGQIVSRIETIVQQGFTASMNNDELVAAFWRLQEEECAAQAVADRQQTLFAVTGDVAALKAAAQEHAGRLQTLAAICGELELRGIDPRARVQA